VAPSIAPWQTALQLSLVGVLVCTWFHSRSYAINCFTLIGLCACYVSIARDEGAEIDLEISTLSIVCILSIMVAAFVVVGFTAHLVAA
jgi:hypothetical protein